MVINLLHKLYVNIQLYGPTFRTENAVRSLLTQCNNNKLWNEKLRRPTKIQLNAQRDPIACVFLILTWFSWSAFWRVVFCVSRDNRLHQRQSLAWLPTLCLMPCSWKWPPRRRPSCGSRSSESRSANMNSTNYSHLYRNRKWTHNQVILRMKMIFTWKGAKSHYFMFYCHEMHLLKDCFIARLSRGASR